MAIDKITTASITDDAVGPTQLNEASNYAFTGTVTGAGITGLGVADSWYLSSSWSGNANTQTTITPFTSQTAGTSSNFTHSSGIFTAPSTGIYYVHSSFAVYKSAGTFFRYIASRIMLGSTQKAMIQTMLGSEGSNNRWVQCNCTAIVDITDTSSDTIKFTLEPDQSSINIENGNTSQVHFIKLAET